ncbi:MAG: hypothetical protein LBQ32_11425 [Burkholderiaceae bacterium]|jgi:hypothetical protein|nr:hypothetical protein [Burkholderiaceae bacterium]
MAARAQRVEPFYAMEMAKSAQAIAREAAGSGQPMILETVVERARQCRDRRARQGARTQRADARQGECRGSKGACAPLDGTNGPSLWLGRALQGEQRRMARRARCWRARSVVTQKVNLIEAANVNVHVAL